jgi:GTPase SAR1 family protein
MRVRVCIVGDYKVGKTTLCENLINGKEQEIFQDHSDLEIYTSHIEHKGKKYLLEFSDYFEKKGYQQQWDEMTVNSYDIFLLVYSIDNKESFEFLDEVHKFLNVEDGKFKKFLNSKLIITLLQYLLETNQI